MFIITIQEGGPSFVQRINIIGNTRTKDKVIRREVLIAPGDILNSVRVETTKKRLDNLGYFSKVETYPDDTGVTGRKDLTIQVEEKRTGSLNFGVGFSTIDELVGFVEMTQGNFDIAELAQLHRGRPEIPGAHPIWNDPQGLYPFAHRTVFPRPAPVAGRRALLPRGRLPQHHLLPAELWLLDRSRESQSRPLLSVSLGYRLR